jgi:hypothetical protein
MEMGWGMMSQWFSHPQFAFQEWDPISPVLAYVAHQNPDQIQTEQISLPKDSQDLAH